MVALVEQLRDRVNLLIHQMVAHSPRRLALLVATFDIADVVKVYLWQLHAEVVFFVVRLLPVQLQLSFRTSQSVAKIASIPKLTRPTSCLARLLACCPGLFLSFFVKGVAHMPRLVSQYLYVSHDLVWKIVLSNEMLHG